MFLDIKIRIKNVVLTYAVSQKIDFSLYKGNEYWLSVYSLSNKNRATIIVDDRFLSGDYINSSQESFTVTLKMH